MKTLGTAVVLVLLVSLSGCGETREPRQQEGSRQAAFAAITADLASLRAAEEMYIQMSDGSVYSADLRELEFVPGNGVTVTVDAASDHMAWAATATHTALGDTLGCAIAYGDISSSAVSYPETPDGMVVTGSEGRPVCDDNAAGL